MMSQPSDPIVDLKSRYVQNFLVSFEHFAWCVQFILFFALGQAPDQLQWQRSDANFA